MKRTPLLQVENVTKYYGPPEARIMVLEDVSFSVDEGEFVAILGHTGSGKSTLLRIVTGLLRPDTGQVLYRGEPLRGVNPYAAIVFQTFALYPWLTALENVELALKARGIPLPQRRQRALELLDMVGLDGFEDAYPRELSGGMRQKVGFARALALEPELLCMDEPFSALDVLSASNLRTELRNLWLQKKLPIKAILMVTHNLEEAVFLADRAIVLSRNPGRVIADIPIPLPHPRQLHAAPFNEMVDLLYQVITEGAAPEVVRRPPARVEERLEPLPHAPIDAITGLLELVHDRGGKEDLRQLAEDLLMEVDDLLPITDAAVMLGLAEVEGGDFKLTDLGTAFAEADVLKRKEIFRDRILILPQIRRIVSLLDAQEDKTVSEEVFLEMLEKDFSASEARAQLETAIDWGRYAELFTYDKDSGELYIEEAEAAQ